VRFTTARHDSVRWTDAGGSLLDQLRPAIDQIARRYRE